MRVRPRTTSIPAIPAAPVIVAIAALVAIGAAPVRVVGDDKEAVEAAFRLQPYKVGEAFVEKRSFVNRLSSVVTDEKGERRFERNFERTLERRTEVLAVDGDRVVDARVRYSALFKGDKETSAAAKGANPILGVRYRVRGGAAVRFTRVDGAAVERVERLELEDVEGEGRPRSAPLLAKVPARGIKVGERFALPEPEARRLLNISPPAFRFKEAALSFKELRGQDLVFAVAVSGGYQTAAGYRFRLEATGEAVVKSGRLVRVEVAGTAEAIEQRMGRSTVGKSAFAVIETLAPAKRP